MGRGRCNAATARADAVGLTEKARQQKKGLPVLGKTKTLGCPPGRPPVSILSDLALDGSTPFDISHFKTGSTYFRTAARAEPTR